MKGRCTQKKITLTFPKHHSFTPEDLLNFVEASEFTSTWSSLGLDDEDDLESLQLCIMANPKGDAPIDGTGGLRKHCHSFDWKGNSKVTAITAYFAYFEDYGIVYLACLDERAEDLEFTPADKDRIRKSLVVVEKELEQRKTVR